MRTVIQELLTIGLNELGTKMKPELNRGTEHQVYSATHNPNIVYKVGDQENVLRWYKIFKSNPEIFPRVFKIGELYDGRYYVTLEKLNVSQVKNEWSDMDSALELTGVVDNDVFEQTLMHVFIDLVLGYIPLTNVLAGLRDSHIIQLIKHWYEFLRKTYQYVKKFGLKGIDINPGNYGYDNQGNLKALDI